MALSYTDLTVEEKNALNQRVTASGYVGNQGIIKLFMFVSNLQVQKIQTFPKNDLEFIAEVKYQRTHKKKTDIVETFVALNVFLYIEIFVLIELSHLC